MVALKLDIRSVAGCVVGNVRDIARRGRRGRNENIRIRREGLQDPRDIASGRVPRRYCRNRRSVGNRSDSE